MSRNANRTTKQESKLKLTPSPPEQQLTYSPPTTQVVLPSAGNFYPPEHPLHDCETIEVKQMTTREEEILTSQALIQKGLVVDRLLKSVILDKSIEPQSLLIGDKNAVLVALRIDAYGTNYGVDLSCPLCGQTNHKEINLAELSHTDLEEKIEITDHGTFVVELPRTKATIELRLLTGVDEKKIAQTNKKTKKYGMERPIATQYSHMIAAVNGDTDPNIISGFASSLPAFDSRMLRNYYKKINPDVDLSFDFQCDKCGHEQGMEVPITANFFWVE